MKDETIEIKKEEEKITYRFNLNLKVPLMINSIPGHVYVEFLMKSLPYMINKALNDEAEIEIKATPEKN